MISSIDNVLVRAAASSIASGRPSSERHRSCTASSASLDALAHALRGGSTGEQLDGVGEGKRCELEHDLTVDVEWNLAGAQDPQPGGGVEEADGESRGGVDDVLAVVEDHQRGGALEPLEQRRLAAARSTRRSTCRRHRLAVAAVSSLANQTPPGATPSDELSLRPVAIATAVLPTPPGPTISTSRSPASRSDRAATSVSRPTSSADIDGRFPAGVSGPSARTVRRGDAERRVVDQDLLLELLQLRSRVEAELVGQLVPDPLVRRQRIGLASGPVQRGDQQLPQALLERVRRHGRFQLADHVADVAEPQPRRELGLDELHPRLFEPGPVRVDPVAVAGGRQHIAAEQRQRRRAQVGGAAVVAGVEQPRRGRPHRAARRAHRRRTARRRACSRHRR